MNSAKVAPTTKSASSNAASVINAAIDIADFSQSCLSDLSAIFRAIRKVSDKDSDAYDLAGIGEYLADDWSGDLDRSRESIRSIGSDTHRFKGEAA